MALMHSNSNKVWPLTLSFMFVFSAALWDIRPYGERYFDLIPIFIAIVFLIGNLSLFRQISRFEFGLGLYIIGYCIYGYLNFQHRSSILIALMFVLFITLRKVFPFEAFRYALRVVFLFTIAIFFAQFFGYHLTGKFIDFQQFSNLISRTNFSHYVANGKAVEYFRPVGLNSEPHSYCVSVALLTLSTLRDKSMRFFHHLGVFSIMLSLSLWGLLLWPCLTSLIITNQEPDFRTFITKFSSSVAITLAGFMIVHVSLGQPLAFKHAYVDRLLSFGHDPSISERFSEHVPHPDSIPYKHDPNGEGAQVLHAEKELNFTKAFFGAGLSTALFVEGYPLNGLAFIFNSSGLIGLVIFLITLCQHLDFGSKRRILPKLALLSVYISLLLSYPMVTYVFFWICLTFVLDSRCGVMSPPNDL